MKVTIDNNGKTATLEAEPKIIKELFNVLVDQYIENIDKAIPFVVTRKKSQKVAVAPVVQGANKKFQRWTSRECNLIRKYYGYARTPGNHIKARHMNTLCRQLPSRNKGTISAKAFCLGLTGKVKQNENENAMRRLLQKGGVLE